MEKIVCRVIHSFLVQFSPGGDRQIIDQDFHADFPMSSRVSSMWCD